MWRFMVLSYSVLGVSASAAKAWGRSSVMVAWVTELLGPGKKIWVLGVLNSRMVWRQAPQGAQTALLSVMTTTARMRMLGP